MDGATMTVELALAQKEVMANVGRNIVMFQVMEAVLKTLTPFMAAPGMIELNGIIERQEKSSKQMLGLVVKDFLKKFRLDQSELRAQFEELLEGRNRLVHHFSQQYGSELQTSAGCENIIRELKKQYQVVHAFASMLEGLRAALLDGLCETTFRGTPEYEEMRAMCTELKARLGPQLVLDVTREVET